MKYTENTFVMECISPDGELEWKEETPNLVTKEGLIWGLNVGFCFTDKSDQFHAMENQSTVYALNFMPCSSLSTPAESMTYASIGSTITEFTSYTCWSGNAWDGTTQRPYFVAGQTRSAGMIIGGGTITTTGAGTIAGICVVGCDTKGDTSDPDAKLLNVGKFTTSQSVPSGRTLKMGYYVCLL